MKRLTTKERFQHIFDHKETDRIPIIDSPWDTTIKRWQHEGMPENISFVDYFGLDHVIDLTIARAPWNKTEIIEETDEYRIYKNWWGTTSKQWKHATSTPQYLNFTIKDPDSWNRAKEKLRPNKNMVDWSNLKKNYRSWREKGYWIQAYLWFGFDITHSSIIGTETMLIALVENPDWCRDMFSTMLEFNLCLFDKIWDAGYQFDSVFWPDDMGYKQNQFFSLDTYRSVLKPFHQRAIDWAHEKGCKTHLHSCGDVSRFIPELIDMGVDALNPLEVKAGMNPIQLKKDYGKDLVLHGGINAVLWDKPNEIKAEMERLIPVLKENGGYVFSSDHSVPDSVSLEDFRGIVNLAKELGTY